MLEDSPRGRCREAGGEKGVGSSSGRLSPTANVVSAALCRFRSSSSCFSRSAILAASRDRCMPWLNARAACFLTWILQVLHAGDWSTGRGGGGIVHIRAYYRTLAYAVLAASCAARKVLPIEMEQAVKGVLLPRFPLRSIQRVPARTMKADLLVVKVAAH